GGAQLLGGAGTVVEGDNGTRNVTVPVTLSAPSSSAVTASWATTDLGAVAPSDYTPVSGTLRFAPGETTKSVTVPVVGDAADENDEVLVVSFSNVVNAAIGGWGLGFGTIVDDDGPPGAPDLLPGLGSVVEGDGGSRTLLVPVTLSAPTAS